MIFLRPCAASGGGDCCFLLLGLAAQRVRLPDAKPPPAVGAVAIEVNGKAFLRLALFIGRGGGEGRQQNNRWRPPAYRYAGETVSEHIKAS